MMFTWIKEVVRLKKKNNNSKYEIVKYRFAGKFKRFAQIKN